MGLLASQMAVESYTLYRHDLESKIASILVAKQRLSATMGELVNTGTDLNPESPEFKLLEQRKQRLTLIDKKLDQTLERLRTQLNMTEGILGGAHKTVENNIKHTFGGGKG